VQSGRDAENREQKWENCGICILSFAMLAGSFISGMAPLAFSLKRDQINTLNVIGSGLLVGTALSVIIPEGVSALYSQQHHDDAHAEHHEYAEFGEPGDHEGHEEEHQHDEVHQYIGLSLLTGFILMVIIDYLGGSHGHSHGEADGSTLVAEKSIESGDHAHETESKASTATIGLVVHAAADGLALGAAGASEHSSLQFIVFLAIMLHKAPASFGLVTYLLQQNVSRKKIKYSLFIFSSAAPFTAITSFCLMRNMTELIPGGTGSAMLFSAGTFLYVATVHVLPEVGKLDRRKTALMVFGSILPLIMSLGHSH